MCESESSAAGMGSEKKIIPLSPPRSRLWDKFVSMIVPWEKITDSTNNFSYYVDGNTKALLMECVASNLKHSKLRQYGCRLKSSSHRILLQSVPGTELCRERLVSAIAMELQVPLLKLDCLDFVEEYDSEEEVEDDDREEEDSNKEVEEDSNKEVEENRKVEDDDREEEEDYNEEDDDEEMCTLKKGDRVKYMGKAIPIQELNNRTLSYGQRGKVCEVKGGIVGVFFNICGLKQEEPENDREKSRGTYQQAILTWLDVQDVVTDSDAPTHDFYIVMELLYGVLQSQQPMIVYFSDYFVWPKMYKYKDKEFFDRFQGGGVAMICAQNRRESGSKEILVCPPSRPGSTDMRRLFTNVFSIKPPEDPDLLNALMKQTEKDMPTWISKGNLLTMHRVLKIHNLSCLSLEHVNIDDKILSLEEGEKIVGWGVNHYLSSCNHPCVKQDKLHIPHESIKLAISRLRQQETQPKKQSKNLKDLATGFHEQSLVSAVVRPEDIGVKFEDVGALENVKKLLHETVILPLRRPELFSHGNLLKEFYSLDLLELEKPSSPLAKALATESVANFINITTATITSMWVGETENLTRALFSFATKLAPVIIFVDEVDSLLGVRGRGNHATSRLNEFMAAWDGLTSKESQRILVIGATNRPFDLDEAVLRRMPRRIYVGLPDAENRCKILKILLKEENLESGFSFEQLADATPGYSGSDLKNMCVAAAYRPIEELLEQESKGEAVAVPRALNLNDFIRSKAKVRPSVCRNAPSIMKLREWNEQYGEGDNEDDRARNAKSTLAVPPLD